MEEAVEAVVAEDKIVFSILIKYFPVSLQYALD